MEILKTHYRQQLDAGDENCHNFEYTAPRHGTCSWNPQWIIPYGDIVEGFGLPTWTCPQCKKVFEVYVPLNSELEE